MSDNKIRSVKADIDGTKLVCQAELQDGLEGKVDLAFYVFRSEERVHIKWYSKDTWLEFDTADKPGYYRVAVFAKRDDGTVEIVKSVPLFMNPLRVSAEEFPQADPSLRAYLLEGPHWNVPVMYYPAAADAAAANKKLFVMMPSAVERWRVRLPVFSRWTWASKGTFPGHVMCIADPTLALREGFGLAWCLGISSYPAIEEMATFVAEFARAKGIANEDVVFWGSSAGGFAALAMASRIAGSTAVAINAQTDALSYHVPEQVDLVREICFGGATEEQIRGRFGNLVDMTARWKGLTSARAILIQNELDVHHYEAHFKPFWQAMGGSLQQGVSHAGLHLAWIYTDQNGHAPETPEMAQKIIGMLDKHD